MLKRSWKGQSTAEYAIVIGLVIAAAVAMQVYVKRGIQSKIKGAIDFNFAADPTTCITIGTGQYEPYYLSQDLNTNRTGTSSSELAEGGQTTRCIVGEELTERTGTITTEKAANNI